MINNKILKIYGLAFVAGMLGGIVSILLWAGTLATRSPQATIMSASQDRITDNIVLDKTDQTISLTCIK